jgi:hypothetical protein
MLAWLRALREFLSAVTQGDISSTPPLVIALPPLLFPPLLVTGVALALLLPMPPLLPPTALLAAALLVPLLL